MDMGFSQPSRYQSQNKEIRIKIKAKEKEHYKQRTERTNSYA